MNEDKLKKIQFKRLLTSYESALEDLEYLKEMASEINSEFSSALAAKKQHSLFENKDIEEAAEKSSKDDKEKESARDPLFKKLFRKIVVKCHPDRMDPDLSIKQQAEYLELYDLANQANDEDNIALLIVVAIKLEIELNEDYLGHIEKIEQDKKKIEEEIQSIQGSIAWLWYHTEEEKRDAMLDDYIQFVQKTMLKPKEETHVKILGLGHPRTGTGFTSKLLKMWGLNVGHEVLEEDGIVAWPLALNKGPWLFIKDIKNIIKQDTLIYNVRDPKTSIPSIVFTENIVEASKKFRVDQGGVMQSENRVEFAINSILAWDRHIQNKRPDIVYRIEDESQKLFDFLKDRGYDVNYVEFNQKVNQRGHGNMDKLKEEFENVRPALKTKINRFCRRYGYDLLYP